MLQQEGDSKHKYLSQTSWKDSGLDQRLCSEGMDPPVTAPIYFCSVISGASFSTVSCAEMR